MKHTGVNSGLFLVTVMLEIIQPEWTSPAI